MMPTQYCKKNTDGDGDGTMSVEASVPWAESTDVFEIVEAVMNLVAAENMIRPWSYQRINIMRSLHEVKYFVQCQSSKGL